jgi:hypothetical protein
MSGTSLSAEVPSEQKPSEQSAEQKATYSVQGKVVEKGSRRPISAANVFVVGRDDLYAVADGEGKFTLTLPEPGSYRLSAVAMDFDKSRPRTITIESGQTEPAKLTLYLMPATLAPIVIQGERNEDRVGKTVISGQELEQVAGGGADPLRAIQSLPGITTGNDASSEPAVRGSRPGDNAYYIDDIQVGYLFHLGGFTSVLPADIVSDFNLFASAFGPQYDDVTGAVFDVGVRNPRTDRFGGKINVSLLYSELLLEGPVNDNQSFFISARRSYFDLLVKEINNEEEGVRFSFPNYYDYFAKYVWDVNDDNRLKFYLNGAGDEVEGTISEDSDIAKNEPIFAGESYSNTDYHNQSLVWDSKAGKHNNRLIVGHRTSYFRRKTGTAFVEDSTWDEMFVREAFRYRRFTNHDISLGGGYNNYKVDINAEGINPGCGEFNPENCSDFTNAPRESFDGTVNVNFFSGFIKDRWRFAKQVTWITGVRYTHEDYLDKEFVEPRLGLEWELSSKNLLTAGWGKYHQFPESRFVVENFGNPHLDHIKADHWVVGIASQLSKKWLVKSDLYYKTFEGFVVADETQNFINGGSGDSYGLELLVKREPVGKLSGWLSLTLSDAYRKNDYTDESFTFGYDQPVIATWVGNYRFSRKYHLGFKWNFHSGSPYTPILRGEETEPGSGRYVPVLGGNNSERLPAYHRLDVRFDIDWTYNKWKLQTYFEIINLYNQCNVAGYDYDVQYTPESKEEVCQLPFLPSFGVQGEF